LKKIIAIAGLGWLGKPLAQHLSFYGYAIKGSVTSQRKATVLEQSGIDTYVINSTEDGLYGPAQGFLKHVDTLVIMIPPGLRKNTGSDYVLKMSHLLSEILTAKVANIIFISSTAVYSDDQGKVTEKQIPLPKTQAAKQLFQVEQLFFNAPGISTSIVRFGGLIGGARQPVKYLAGRRDLKGGNAPVNLIHKKDCIGIISSIIKQNAYGHIFNGVHPNHPKKKEYYSQKAKELGLIAPHYQELESESLGKQIDSINLKGIIGYRFKEMI